MKLLICAQVVDKNHPILGFFHGWILEFSKHFAEVHVICLQKGEQSLPSHVHIYSLGKEEGESNIKYLYRFYKYFGKIFFSVRVDFVFFHMGAIFNIIAMPFFLVRKLLGTQFYWWKAHGRINWVGTFALLFVDRVYTSTESGFSVATPKRHVVGQAIDVRQFVTPSPTHVRKNEIIFVGRIMPVKRIEDFLDTAKILQKKYPNFTYSVIGPVGDEEYYQKMKVRCSNLQLDHVVSFVGPKTQAELVVLYQSARVFLNTSVTHSMDKTVLEAMLCGCIPVTGNKAFFELLSADGLYKEVYSPEVYAEVIDTVLSGDFATLQSALRQRVMNAHSLQTFSTRIFGV